METRGRKLLKRSNSVFHVSFISKTLLIPSYRGLATVRMPFCLVGSKGRGNSVARIAHKSVPPTVEFPNRFSGKTQLKNATWKLAAMEQPISIVNSESGLRNLTRSG